MSQLETNSSNGGLDQANPSDPISPIQSQAGTPTDDLSSQENSTQDVFSTQAPTKVSNGLVVGRHADPDASIRHLLALLGSKRPNTQQALTRDHESTRTYASPYEQKPRDNLVNEGFISAPSSSSTSMQHNTMPLNPAIPPIEPQAGSQKNHGHLQSDVRLSQTASQSDFSKSQDVGKTEDVDINGGLLFGEMSTGGGIEINTEVREDANRSVGYVGTNPKLQKRQDTTRRPNQDAENPWEGLTRIPRKYVQIPKDQRNLLELDDAWYPQPPSNRQPGINLPPKVLIDLQAFRDRRRDRVSNRQSDGHSDNHSDSLSEHSENQKGRIAKEGSSVKKAARKSVHGNNNRPSSEIASSDQDNATVHMASEQLSSDRSDSSVECSLDATEMDSECEMAVRNTEVSYIQVDKILPNGQILIGHEVDASSASQDLGDGSSAEEMISWPSSPNRVETCSPRNHSLQEDPQGSTADNRMDAPNSFQLQASPGEISPIVLIEAESTSTEEGDADSRVESFSVLQNGAKLQHTAATARMTQTSKNGSKGSSVLFSSSPVEMELSVPYALGNQTRPSDDIVMTDALDAAQPMSFTGKQPHSMFDLERTQRALSYDRSPRDKTRNMESDGTSKVRQQEANISSDPIIPGTFGSELSNIFTHPEGDISATNRITLEGRVFEANQIISATPGPTSRFHSYSPSPAADEKHLAQRKKSAESETPMRKGCEIRSSNDISVSVDIANKASVVRQTIWNTNESEIPTSPTNQEPSQLSILGTQAISSEPLPPPPQAPIGGEIILSTLATPIKRRVSGMRDVIEPSPKRRRTLQVVIFDSVQGKDSAIDPAEMAKANRRKFLQELSLEHSSPIQSPNKAHEACPARSNMASGDVAEMVSEYATVRDPIGSWNDDIPPMGTPLGEMETSSVHPEKLSVEDLRDNSLDHSGRDVNEINAEASDGRRNDSGNILKESTSSYQGRTPKDSEHGSAETLEHEQDKQSPTVTKVQSGDDHTSQTETIFDIFNTTYPSYDKSFSGFIRACVCLDWLHSMKKAPHPSLWDDFIRAFSVEYSDYVEVCKLSKQRPMSAPEFYNNHVPEPAFTERIMTLARLQEAILLDPGETAKHRAIIREKKHQKSQRPISTAFSQLTTTSEISEAHEDMPTAFLGSFSSTQQLPNPSAVTSCKPSDHAGDVKMVRSHFLDAVSTPCIAPAKKPFFETLSQLVRQGRHNDVESPKLSTSASTEDAQNNTHMEEPSERFGSRDIEIVQASVIKQTPRHLPWSSLPQERPELEELLEVNGAVPGRSSARSQSQGYRQPALVSPLMQRELSPILGNVTLNSISTGKQVLQAEIAPTPSSNLDFRQNSIFKTPHLPASMSHGRRITSTPGLGDTGLEGSRMTHRGEGPHSLQIAKIQKPIISTITATFKDFSRAFVPRQKRRSNVFSRVSTPSSDASPSRIVIYNTMGSKPLAEPDTQVWRF